MLYLGRSFADLSPDCSLSRRARIQSRGQISIGPDASIAEGVVLNGRSESRIGIKIGAAVAIREYAWLSANEGIIEIGDRSVIGQSVHIHGCGFCKIGADVLIGGHTAIMPGTHVFSDLTVPIARQGMTNKGIEIEDDVWIGANTVILDGVTIATGAVVGAGSVVTKDVPAFAVAYGNPARVKRFRGVREIAVG